MATTKSIAPIFQSIVRPAQASSSPYICRPCLRHQQQQRSIHRAKQLPVPKPTPFVPDVPTFLKLIGRGLSAQAQKIGSWDKLFTMSSEELKEAGIEPARTRRYLLNWRQKFRNGQFGVGGDFKYVEDGVAELRVVEVPALPAKIEKESQQPYFSATHTPGMQKLILNLPAGSTSYTSILKPGQSTQSLQKPTGYTLRNGHIISGPYALPSAGSNGSVAKVTAQEGMWEFKLGQKVFGGERRRAETLHKLGVAEHRKAIGTAR